MTSPETPYFPRAGVNRLWAYFFGAALVGQSEAGGAEGPTAHAELLDELARAFAAHNFDTKFLIRAITSSQAYQRTSVVSHPSQKNPRAFARMPLRGLTP